jgi:alanine racemase
MTVDDGRSVLQQSQLRTAVIETSVLMRNAAVLTADAHPGTLVVADVRADAYGHGLAGVAPPLDAAGYGFLVSTGDEADRLRSLGVTGRILTVRTSSAEAEPAWPHDRHVLGTELYGLDSESHPEPQTSGLAPVMTLSARVIAVKSAEAGVGVSYGYVYRTRTDTTLAMVALGYSDGLDRHACDGAVAWLDGRLHPIAGRVAMDVFMLDVGDTDVALGDEVVIFGDPAQGVPSPVDWARSLHKTGAEVTSMLGDRIVRSYR